MISLYHGVILHHISWYKPKCNFILINSNQKFNYVCLVSSSLGKKYTVTSCFLTETKLSIIINQLIFNKRR